MGEHQLKEKIEKLRLEMIRIAGEKGCLLDQHVVEASRKLDLLILQYQRISKINKMNKCAMLIETPA